MRAGGRLHWGRQGRGRSGSPKSGASGRLCDHVSSQLQGAGAAPASGRAWAQGHVAVTPAPPAFQPPGRAPLTLERTGVAGRPHGDQTPPPSAQGRRPPRRCPRRLRQPPARPPAASLPPAENRRPEVAPERWQRDGGGGGG